MYQDFTQLTIFDFLPKKKADIVFNSIEYFDDTFNVGDLFYNDSCCLQVTDLQYGSLMAQVKNVTLENKKMYIGQKYYINKESLGKYFFETPRNLSNKL